MLHTPVSLISSIPQLDQWISHLDALLGAKPPFRVVPAATLKRVPVQPLMYWCKTRGLWQITTEEQVDWVKQKLGKREAKDVLEICAGRDNLGQALGVTQTDAHLITKNVTYRQAFRQYGEAMESLPATVQDYEAQEAVERFSPKVVLGCWVMQKGTEEVPQSSPYGVDELAIIDAVDCYIHFGNKHSHSLKSALVRKHEEFQFDWLVSRTGYPQDNVIYVWGK